MQKVLKFKKITCAACGVFTTAGINCNTVKSLLALLIAVMIVGCATTSPASLPTAEGLNLQRFMGTWHEVARLPLAFEKNCVAASFYYVQKEQDEISISSLCWYKSLNGPMRRAQATAYLRDLNEPGQLIIQFSGPFTGPYNIIHVSPDYQFALVGAPDRKHLWILSRTFTPTPEQVEALLQIAQDNEYDISKLVYTKELRQDDHL